MSISLPKRLHAFTHKPLVRRIAIGLAGLAVLYSVVGFVVLPGIIQSQTEKLAAEKLHRQMTLGKVEVNPFTWRVTLRDLKLMEPDGKAVFAAFDALTVNLSSESVLRAAPVAREIRLTKPSLRLVRTDAHHYNIDDIINLIANLQPSKEPARFSLNNIQVEDGRIEFEDKPAKAVHTVADLRLGVPFISSLPSEVQIFVEPLLSAKLNGAPLLIKGKARPFAEPREATVELDLDGVDLTRYLEYLPFRPGFKMPSARLDGHLSASFRQFKDKAPALMLSGGATLKSLRVTEPNGKPVLTLPELAMTLGNTDVLSGRFEVARLLFNGLEAEVARDRDGRLSLMHLLPPTQPVPASKPAAKGSAMQVTLGEVQVRGATLRYRDEHAPRPLLAGMEKLDLSIRKVVVDTGGKTVTLGEVRSGGGNFLVRQDKPAAQDKAAPPVTRDDADAAAKTGDAYVVSVGHVGIDNWSGRFEDQGQPQPAVTQVAPLRFSMNGLSTASSTPAQMELHATINNTGKLAISGGLGFAPFQTQLAVDLKNVDILPLQPYIANQLNLRVTRAGLSGSGKLQLRQGEDGALAGGYKGDLSVQNLATVDQASASDFLRWKSLALSGMDVRLQPFSLTVDQVALNDFFARVIIDRSGRINVQDILRGSAGEQKSLTERNDDQPAASRSVSRTAQAQMPNKNQAGKTPPISIRKLTLQGGRVHFTDNFIRPNYSANLGNFGGAVTGLSSDPSSNANVDLHGEVNRAPLTVAGRINPLRGDLFLDLKAMVRGMELAALSPYSGRYLGYGIEKGKLSFEVAYKVENRTLTAQNRLILDQLAFGKKVDSPTAMDLPIQFAMALLRDRNGVVDINVPIGGSLDDPQFSIGGIIMKVIGNAVLKAVTAPFSVLGSLFGGGGGEQLSSLQFDAGRFAIAPAAEAKLNSLAKALAERPALQLEITGRADPETDSAGLKRAAIDRKVRALKAKDLRERGESVAPGNVVVSADEYPALLARVYRDEKFPKPRNLIGLQKNLPVEEMEQLMIANTAIGDDDLAALGIRRAQAAKDWLVKSGHVADERIFILASRVESASARNDGVPAGGVLFSLK